MKNTENSQIFQILQFCSILGVSQGCLRQLGGVFGLSRGLGGVLGGLRGVLEASWTHLGASWRHLGQNIEKQSSATRSLEGF